MDQRNAISRWANFFITKYKTTILLILAIIIAGTWGVMNNQRQDFPTIPSNFIFVSASQVGASAEDIEQDVLLPLEQSVVELDGLNVMRSTASDNFGTIVLDMSDVEGTPAAAEEVEKLVTRTSLPAGVETEVEILDVVGPSLVYALTSDEKTPAEMLEYVPAVESKLLAASNSIQKIDVLPENEFEIAVELDTDEVNDRGFTVTEIQQAIQGALTSFPGGSITTDDDQSLSISIDAGVNSLEEFRKIEVRGASLSDFATVERTPTDTEVLTLAGYVDEDGNPRSEESVYLFIYKQVDGDVIDIAADLTAEMEAISDSELLPEGTQLVELYDNSAYVADQIDALLYNGWLGLILILVVLMFFINLRTGIIVAAIIPLAFLITLGVLYAIGFTINILTLFGLLLVLGILVDNAIVIAEGVTHSIESGLKRGEAVMKTMKNLGPAVTAATLTTVVVFIPFASIGGIVGSFLKFIPYTIIIMLIASYFLAITVTPMLARYFMKEETRKERRTRKLKNWEKMTVVPAILWFGQKMIDRVEDAYGHAMTWIHKHKWKKVSIAVLALVLFVWSIGGFASKLEVEQFPSDDSILMIADFDFPSDMSFQAREDAVRFAMDEAVKTDYFDSYYAFEGQVFLVFQDVQYRTDDRTIYDLQDEANERLAETVIPALEEDGIGFQLDISGAGPPDSSWDVTVEMRGTNSDDLAAAAADLATEVTEWDGVVEVENGFDAGLVDSIAVTLDPEEVRDAGLSSSAVNAVINGFFSEQQLGSLVVRDDGVSDDVVMRFNTDEGQSVDDIRDLAITPFTDVDDVATVEEVSTSQSIRRLDQKRVVSVQFRVDEGVEATVLEQQVRDYLTQEHLDQFHLEADDVTYGGFAAQINDNYDDLVLVFILAIIAVYLILVYQFNSYVQPGLIMLTVPLALIAVFPALVGIESSLNMISGLGVVALIGIVVNDAIVFMDYFNRLRKENEDWELSKVLVETGRARFKPILSTSITTIFGILPLTIVDPFWRGLGTALMAGLASATVGTLLVFPILLSWTEWVYGLFRKLKKRLKTAVKRA